MYYIVNQTDHIIAADSDFLKLFSASSIDDLHKNIALGTIEITSPLENGTSITISDKTTSYSSTSHTLSGVLGELTLVEISDVQAKETTLDSDTIIYDDEISILDDEPITFNDVTPEVETAQKEEISILEDDEPFDLISEEETPSTETIKEVPEADDTATVKALDDTPIYIDIEDISQKIGISSDDYNSFLNEYIDTALTLEEDLNSSEAKQKSHAIDTLSHLSNVLYLPVITDIVEKIQNSSDDAQNENIQALYHTLARLVTSSTEKIESVTIPKVTKTTSSESFGTIDLSDVKSIHFDFQLEEAANDLSLPVELIEEFVVDFIEQAHEETKKMLEAYEEGDLDTIQKIGHLLKGTSSNLRINPLSDTLYEIQFCEDSSKLEALIKEYWAHFLSFEHQINVKLKK